MLVDVFECTAHLNPTFHKGGISGGNAGFSDLSVYINLTITELSGIKQAVK